MLINYRHLVPVYNREFIPKSSRGKMLRANKESSLSDQLLTRLESMIINREIKWGDRINEKELSERWGVSRTPIREACRILQQAGIVDIIKNRGVIVRRVSLQDILHLFDVRAALERLAAIQAAENITKKHLDFFYEIIEQMSEAGSRENGDEYVRLNSIFHQKLYELSQNRPLLKFQKDLRLQSRLFRRAIQTERNFLERNIEHQRIIEALNYRDADLAGRLSEDHLIKSKERFLNAIDSSGKILEDVIERDAVFGL